MERGGRQGGGARRAYTMDRSHAGGSGADHGGSHRRTRRVRNRRDHVTGAAVVPIRRPSATDVGALITALGSPNSVRREAAIARLTIIGAPAFDRLAAVHAEPGTPREVLTAILRIFEATANPRALVAARRSLKVGGDVAVAAAATLRALLASSDPDTSSAALDSLMVVATDPAAERRVRGAAVDALQELPPDARARVKFALDAGAS